MLSLGQRMHQQWLLAEADCLRPLWAAPLGLPQDEDFSIELRTKRFNFATCVFNNEIFIVGGENSKEGCLKKCALLQEGLPGQLPAAEVLAALALPHLQPVHPQAGGTDKPGSRDCSKVLSPEIYCAETEDWRLITLSNPQLSFGL
jgi:hypothetical protein